jgi:hypothetical protein
MRLLPSTIVLRLRENNWSRASAALVLSLVIKED